MPTCLSSSEPTASRRLSTAHVKNSAITGSLSWIRCKTLACIGPLFGPATVGPSKHATTPSKITDRPPPATTNQPTRIRLPLSQALLLVAQEGRQQGHNLAVHAHGRPR